MLLNIIKQFYHKYFIKIILTIVIVIILTGSFIAWQFYPQNTNIDFFLADYVNDEDTSMSTNIDDFLTPSKATKIVKKQHKENIAKQNIPPLHDNTPIQNKKLQQEIADLKSKIINLQKEVNILKNRSLTQNQDALSMILIELYHIKNLAFQGADFANKIPPLLKLSEFYPHINKSLLAISSLKKLATKAELQTLLNQSEEFIIKAQAKKQAKENDNFMNNSKVNLLSYIKIKKVKNLAHTDPLYKINKIRKNIAIENYQIAKQIIAELKNDNKSLKELKDSIEKIIIFNNEFTNITNIILNQTEQEKQEKPTNQEITETTL